MATRFILTAAQNNTPVDPRLWKNFMALKDHYDARLIVGTFTYNMHTQKDQKRKTSKEATGDKEWWDEKVLPYIVDERMELAPGLVWCGEMQILPTAVRPLSGMESYGGSASVIFPHTKHQLVSVPSLKRDFPQLLFTTGSVTEANYIQKKAGLKAEFHHILGGLLAEVNPYGEWFVRHINMDTEGRLYDLDILVDNGKVLPNTGVSAIVYGDAHVAQMDVDVEAGCWHNENALASALAPKVQVIHDVFDGLSVMKYPHLRKEHHTIYQGYALGTNKVYKEIADTSDFLNIVQDYSEITVVVNSNHDQMLQHWLQARSYKEDPENADFYLDAERFMYNQLSKGKRKPNLLEWACRRHNDLKDVSFLKEDESFLVHDIECGMHGHLGPNGSKGSIYNLARMGYKSFIGHTHAAGVFEGAWQVGTSSKMDMGYNAGPSSWSHTHGVIYPNGKRALITMRRDRWRAL